MTTISKKWDVIIDTTEYLCDQRSNNGQYTLLLDVTS